MVRSFELRGGEMFLITWRLRGGVLLITWQLRGGLFLIIDTHKNEKHGEAVKP